MRLASIEKYAVPLGLCCLAAGLVAVPAEAITASRGVVIKNVECTPTFTSVTCTFTTGQLALGVVATGTDKSVLIPTPKAGYVTHHSTTVNGLEPATKYVAKLSASSKTGRSGSSETSFTTLGPGSGIPATTTWQKGYHWLLNGGQFVPVAGGPWQWDSNNCPTERGIQEAVSMGIAISFMVAGICGSTTTDQVQLMHQLVAGQLWWNDVNPNATITPDWNYEDESELIALPTDRDRARWDAPIANDGSIYAALRYHRPAYSDVSIDQPQSVLGFWLTVAAGGWPELTAGVVPTSAMLRDATPMVRRLKAISPVMLYGEPVAVKQSWKVPLWTNTGGNKWHVEWKKAAWPSIRVFGWRYGGRTYVLAINDGLPTTSKWGLPLKIATNWNVHKNGVWHHYTWNPNKVTVTLNGVQGSVTSLWGAKGLKLNGSKATIRLPSLGVGWYEITGKK